MKRLKLIGISTLVCLLLFSTMVMAAGRVYRQRMYMVSSDTRTVTFRCIGDSVNGSIPNTDTSSRVTDFIQGWYLYKVEAFPTSGGTAPDAADVMIYDADGLDLLGSEDGGTTAYAGLTLIHATLKRATLPNLHLPRAGSHVNYYPKVTGVLTLDVDNQATASAKYTIVLTFIK